MSLIWLSLIFALGFNILLFIPAFIYKTDKLTDISYALTFAFIAIVAFINSDQTSYDTILLVAVLAWAARLGGFLLMRVSKKGKDSRFDGMRESFIRFFRFWILQGLTVFVVMIAAILFWQSGDKTISTLTWIGLMVFVFGLLLEAVADMQKYSFGQNPANKNKWIENGVWKYSRHPNYLGEMMVWLGLYLFVFNTLDTSGRLIGLVSPLYIISLLMFASGVPILEKSADERWGDLKAYKLYKKRVPVLIPRLFK